MSLKNIFSEAGAGYSTITSNAWNQLADASSEGNFSIDPVAIGFDAGSGAAQTVAIGDYAGAVNQGVDAIAIGQAAGQYNQGASSVAIGLLAGFTGQGGAAVAIGQGAGQWTQAGQGVAIGFLAGCTGMGASSVAIGSHAGCTGMPNNSICINATGNYIVPPAANTTVIAPISNGANIAGNTNYCNMLTLGQGSIVQLDVPSLPFYANLALSAPIVLANSSIGACILGNPTSGNTTISLVTKIGANTFAHINFASNLP